MNKELLKKYPKRFKTLLTKRRLTNKQQPNPKKRKLNNGNSNGNNNSAKMDIDIDEQDNNDNDTMDMLENTDRYTNNEDDDKDDTLSDDEPVKKKQKKKQNTEMENKKIEIKDYWTMEWNQRVKYLLNIDIVNDNNNNNNNNNNYNTHQNFQELFEPRNIIIIPKRLVINNYNFIQPMIENQKKIQKKMEDKHDNNNDDYSFYALKKLYMSIFHGQIVLPLVFFYCYLSKESCISMHLLAVLIYNKIAPMHENISFVLLSFFFVFFFFFFVFIFLH